MKVYISADIEGVACICSPSEADPKSPDYTRYREQMTSEVRAACEGAFEAGAGHILVKDAHGTGRNIDPHRLSAPESCALELIRGWSGHPLSMIQDIDNTFSMAAFVGYHSAAGRAGNPLAHTVSGRLFSQVELNGRCASEFYLFALAASTVSVPVGFVSGDKALCEEAASLIDGITTVATLQGAGASVHSILPEMAVRSIHAGVRRAVSSPPPPLLPIPKHFSFKLEYVRPTDAYAMSFYPGVRQVSERGLLLETNEYMDVLTFLRIASRMP